MAIGHAGERLGWEPKHRLPDTLPEMIRRLKQDPRKCYEIDGLSWPEDEKETSGDSKASSKASSWSLKTEVIRRLSMGHNEEIDPRRQPGDKADLPPPPPHDPIEPDPMNPVPVPPSDTEPRPAERPDLDWAEHED